MDAVHMAGSPASSPVKGRTGNFKKAAGRGLAKKNARKNAVMPRKGGRPKGRGRNKTYEDPRAQAAYDRQKVLRDLYSEVASAIKPVLEDLADMSVKKLIESPTAYKEVPEYRILQRELDDRLEETMRAADREFNTRTAIATREYQLNTAVTEKKFHEGYDYAAQEFYDASLKRAGLVAELQRENVDVNLPDTTFTYIEKPDEVVSEQATWVLIRNGIKVPYPHLLEENKKAAVAKVQVTKGKPPAKRKAEDQPDGQPDSKKPTGSSGSTKLDNGDDVSTPQPRHIKGLLSAETEPDGEPESNAASPSPESDPKMDFSRGRKDLPDLPNGASEPDKWGVRTVMRRGPRANNRLILPPLTFDDDEIGFRDSTNDSTKKATRGTRGRFLDNPNSRNLHIDRTIVTYDCLDYEDGALDSELVHKHSLHPKYGLFLPDSQNEAEPPKSPVSGSNPVVVTTSNGATLHASRSVRGYNMDTTLREDVRKDRLSVLLAQYCEEVGIESDEITTEEMRERKRQHIVVQAPVVSKETEEDPADEEPDTNDAEVDESVAMENAKQLLHAAAYLEHDRPNHPASNQRSSRPYDAVRDVFTTTEHPPLPSLPPMEIDTFNLSLLADISEQVSLQRESQFEPTIAHRLEPQVEYRHEYQMEHHPSGPFEYRHEYFPDHRPSHHGHHVDHRLDQTEYLPMGDSMIDPRLLGASNPMPPPSNAFLQTALNPPPTLAHIAPAPSQGIEPPTQPPMGRIPFTNQGSGKASPVLPPLRPSRREKGIDSTHPPPPPLVPQAPDFGTPLGMIQSNSGSFFPPAPSRSYHQGYSLLEQSHIMNMPFSMSGGNMVSSQPSPHLPPSHRPSYQPPSPTMSSHGHIGTMSMHMPHGSSVSPPGSSMGLQSPTGPPGSRHRASISSGSNGAANAKYRKIAAAPIPHNRPWPANGGAELRLAHYDHKEAIKDYRANEPPPRTGPTTIRGWSVNNVSKGRKGLKKEDSEEKDSPSITTFINKWNPSEKTIG